MVDVGGSLAGITKRFSRRAPWVLKGVDLELHPGSRTVIVGGNGSGKSTLLRIGAGVSWPNGGVVRLPAHIGYVPERLAARIRFTGAEYLAHMGRIKGLDPGIIRARSRELLERLDVQPGPQEPIESLSKGNRQKLVIAQASWVESDSWYWTNRSLGLIRPPMRHWVNSPKRHCQAAPRC